VPSSKSQSARKARHPAREINPAPRQEHKLADTFSLEGAEMLAAKIAKHWAKQGYAVETRLEKSYDTIAKRTIYFVRTDLINGLPRGKAMNT
jgi:fatty acid-binding protein DegV